jgi:hypothetical protein
VVADEYRRGAFLHMISPFNGVPVVAQLEYQLEQVEKRVLFTVFSQCAHYLNLMKIYLTLCDSRLAPQSRENIKPI